MTTDPYNDKIIQGLLSAPLRNLYERTKELYDSSLLIRYYNDLSWIYGITDQEIIDFKEMYDNTIKELRQRPQLEDMLLTNQRINKTLDCFPKFDEKQFLLLLRETVFRGLVAYIFFPYAFYLMFIHIKKTRLFRNILSDILINSKTLIDTFETDNMEGWMQLQNKGNV